MIAAVIGYVWDEQLGIVAISGILLVIGGAHVTRQKTGECAGQCLTFR